MEAVGEGEGRISGALRAEGYTRTAMRHFMIILLLAASLALPWSVLGVEDCARCASAHDVPAQPAQVDGAEASADADRCCSGSMEERDDSRQKPCDGCDCPLSCCVGAVHPPMAAMRSSPLLGVDAAVGRITGFGLAVSEPPHLRGLKRPPRLTTSA